MPCLLEGKGENQYSTKYSLISPALGPHVRQVRTIMVNESWVDRRKRERGRVAHGLGERGGFEKARIVRDRQTWMAYLHIDSKVTSVPLWLTSAKIWFEPLKQERWPVLMSVALLPLTAIQRHALSATIWNHDCVWETCRHRGLCQSEWPLLLPWTMVISRLRLLLRIMPGSVVTPHQGSMLECGGPCYHLRPSECPGSR